MSIKFHVEVKELHEKDDGSYDYGTTVYEQTVDSLELWDVIQAVNGQDSTFVTEKFPKS